MDNGHLSEADLEIIWNSKNSRSEGQPEQRLLAHCRECVPCGEMLSDFEDVQREIDSLKDLSSTEDASCPSVDSWIKLAAGLVGEQLAMQMLKHASECRQCSQQLIRAQGYVADNLEPVSGLESSTAKWQREVARQIAAQSSTPKSAPLRARWFWIPATAAVIVCAVLGVWFFNVWRSPNVNDLLAEAYGQNRTFEPRFSGAKYGPIRSERSGNGQSMLNQSPALLEALPVISRNLEKEPNNPVWLDAKGRADLLGRNYGAAIQSFQKALDVDPNAPMLLIDAASAYFERAQIADRPEDYGRAIELLSQALKKNPDDPIALYNRALVSEKMFLFHQAAEDWTRYLQVAPKDEWYEEATRHLNDVRQKLTDQRKRAVEPLVAPADIARRASTQDEQVIDTLDRRPEEYLDQAIRRWLPVAFPADTGRSERSHVRFQRASAKTDYLNTSSSPLIKENDGRQAPPAFPSERLALEVLADVLGKKHGDEWLLDVIKAPPSTVAVRAIHALAEATDANASGSFDIAREKAKEALYLFQRAGNAAGESRAQYEMVYALERTQLGQRCLEAAFPLASRLATHRYSWIQVQLDIVQASCWAQVGQFSKAATYLNEALRQAEKSKYGILHLRALGIAASLLTSEGNSAAACAIDLRGLAQYWSGSFPPMRAHQFYSDMGFPAHDTGQWGFSLAVEKEAANAIALTEQRLGEAVARQRLAQTAAAAGDLNLAEAESARAKDIFASLPAGKAALAWQASEEIELARLEVNRRELDQSLLHLSKARKQLPQIVNYFLALHFYQTLGELQHLKGDQPAAERALRSAVIASEWGLASSRNELDRLSWAHETAPVYRGLAELHWQSGDVEGALRLWEWYRGAAIRASQQSARADNGISGHAKSRDVDFGILESDPALPALDSTLQGASVLHNSTILSYMQLDKGLVVWAYDDRGIAANWIAVAPEQMSRMTLQFRDECANPDSDLNLLRQDARQLYDLLIAPVADHLSPQRTLVVEPDETVAATPMAALLNPAGVYLGEIYSLVYSPGLLYQEHLRKPERLTSHRRALVIGSPALSGDLAVNVGPLTDAVDEARYVASKFVPAIMFTGAQASLSNVRTELPRATIFHFAGHALANAEQLGLMLAPASPEASADTTFLDVSSLTTIDLRNLQLAVLSACSTATGSENEPKTRENLVGTFLRAGVPHVVASRWNVHSAATARFMGAFYDHLVGHETVSGSLQAAAAELRHEPGMAHPYYWAAFSAFGR